MNFPGKYTTFTTYSSRYKHFLSHIYVLQSSPVHKHQNTGRCIGSRLLSAIHVIIEYTCITIPQCTCRVSCQRLLPGSSWLSFSTGLGGTSHFIHPGSTIMFITSKHKTSLPVHSNLNVESFKTSNSKVILPS